MDTAFERFSTSPRHQTILFSDEKIYAVEQVFNRQNSRIVFKSLEKANSKGQLVGSKLHPASATVWAAITSDGKMPLIFLPQGIKVDAVTYLDSILKKELLLR